MPRSAYFSKEEIAAKGLEIVREGGMDALTARALSKKLGCSLSPIFTVYDNMDAIKSEVRKAAAAMFDEYVKDVTDYTPAFKEFGMRMVRFAREEEHVFSLLFLSKEASENPAPAKAQECLAGIEKEYDLSDEQVFKLFRQMWTFACGIALLNSQNKDYIPEEIISEMISMQFASTLTFIKSGKPVPVMTPYKK